MYINNGIKENKIIEMKLVKRISYNCIDMYVQYKTCLYKYLQNTLKHINCTGDELIYLNTFLLKRFSDEPSIT